MRASTARWLSPPLPPHPARRLILRTTPLELPPHAILGDAARIQAPDRPTTQQIRVGLAAASRLAASASAPPPTGRILRIERERCAREGIPSIEHRDATTVVGVPCGLGAPHGPLPPLDVPLARLTNHTRGVGGIGGLVVHSPAEGVFGSGARRLLLGKARHPRVSLREHRLLLRLAVRAEAAREDSQRVVVMRLDPGVVRRGQQVALIERLPVKDDGGGRVAKGRALEPRRLCHQRHPLRDGAPPHVTIGVAEEREQPPRERTRRGTLRPKIAAASAPTTASPIATAPLRRVRRLPLPLPLPLHPPPPPPPPTSPPRLSADIRSVVSTIATSPSSGSSLAPPDASSEGGAPPTEGKRETRRRSARLRTLDASEADRWWWEEEEGRGSEWLEEEEEEGVASAWVPPPTRPPPAPSRRPSRRPSTPQLEALAGTETRTCPTRAAPTLRPMTFPAALRPRGPLRWPPRCRAGDGFVGLIGGCGAFDQDQSQRDEL